jgi:hypothetical protein
MAAGRSGAGFRVGPDAKAASVVLDHLNENGPATFARAR